MTAATTQGREPGQHVPKVLVYQGAHSDQYAEMLRRLGVENVASAADATAVTTHLHDTEIVFGWNFPARFVPDMPKLKWIQWSGAGVDAAFAGDRPFPPSVQLTRIVNQFSRPIAEYIFTYLLHVVKDVERSRKAQINHQWDPFRTPLLAGLTIGVAGLGSIGREVVRKARAFDMNVVGLSATGSHADLVDIHFKPDEWAAFVKSLDVLVLTLPLTDATRYVVDASLLSQMRPQAIVVNIGRGALVREADLATCLQNGSIRAAILDVFEREPLPPESPLWDLPTAYLTAHMSGPSDVRETCEFFAENLTRYTRGERLNGSVDLHRQY